MMGIQIGGGEWLFGPEVTARYGGGLMWIATVAIVLQVFYNMECGRYALYCGEPVFTGFMRMPARRRRSGSASCSCFNSAAFIPGLSTHGGGDDGGAACSIGSPARTTAGWSRRWRTFACSAVAAADAASAARSTTCCKA